MVTAPIVRRGDVFLVALDPTRGAEIRKARPCVVVSPDDLNTSLPTYIVAPLTSGGHAYPFRILCEFGGKSGHIVLDQIRTVDGARLLRRLGKLPAATLGEVMNALQAMFAP